MKNNKSYTPWRALRRLWTRVVGGFAGRRTGANARSQDLAWEAQERGSNPYLRVESPDSADVLFALDPPDGVDLRAENELLRRRIDFWMRMAAESEAQVVLLASERDAVRRGGPIPVSSRPGGRIRKLG